MLAPSKITLAGVLTVLAAAPLVNAHGYMSVPKVTFAINGDPTQFCATMDGPTTLTAPSGMSFTTDPASNAKAFTAALKASSYKSVKALVDAKATFISGASKECGVTSATGAKQPLPAQYVEWAHSASEGFTPSHQGPCEVWCDDKLAFSNDNCAANYPAAPAKLPYDKSKCTGASMLKIYWLALHSSTWQAYINCAPLEGGSGSGATTPSVTPVSKTPAPANKTTAPAKTTAPSTGDEYDDEDCDDELPIADSDAGSVGADEDCDDELPIADSDAGSVGADEDCDDDLPIADDEDCDDELPIADSDAGSIGSDADPTTKAPVTTTKPSSGTKAPATTTKPSNGSKTPKPTKPSSSKTPKPATQPPSTGGDDGYSTPSPASGGEIGGDADTGASEDCDDELPIADDEDCDDELPIADSKTGSVGADEDCDDELPIADDEDCDDELDIAGNESTRTSDLDFSSLSTADKSKIGKVDAY